MIHTISVIFIVTYHQFEPIWEGLLQLLRELRMMEMVKQLQAAVADHHSTLYDR